MITEQTRCVYIQGCARSGNTLMRELCACGFRHTCPVRSAAHSECSVEQVIALLADAACQRDERVLVASRDQETSLSMHRELIAAQPGIKVIWMLRHPLDVLTSVHGIKPGEFYVSPERMIESLKLHEEFRAEQQVLTVRYEELVANPVAVQARVAAKLNLEPAHSFAECYQFFPQSADDIQAMHSIRPIDSFSVNRWKKLEYRDYLKEIIREHPELLSLGCGCGYDLSL